ncbi:hypothetical protein HDU84_003091 [Entophlyctis sp. JEL0112]|nr:hypothetical protein HDU84_003091 [Entophlyctis sp. JEL0112]
MATRWRTVLFVLLGLITACAVTLVAIQFYEQAYAAGAVNIVLLLVALATGGLGATLAQSYRVLLITVSASLLNHGLNARHYDQHSCVAIVWFAFGLFNLLLLTNVVAVSPLSQSSIFLGSDAVSYYNPGSSTATPTANATPITSRATSTATASISLTASTSSSAANNSLPTGTVATVNSTTTIAAARRRDDANSTTVTVSNTTATASVTNATRTTTAISSTNNPTTVSSSTQSSQGSATMPIMVTVEPIIVGIQLLFLLASAIVAQFVQPEDAYTVAKSDYSYPPNASPYATSVASGLPGKKPHADDPIDMTQLRAGPPNTVGRNMAANGNTSTIRPTVATVSGGVGSQRGYGDSPSPGASRGPTLSTRPPRGTSAAASASAGAGITNAQSARNNAGGAAAPLARKYTAGPHNSAAPIAGGNAAALRRDVYSVYTVASDAGLRGGASAPLGDNGLTSGNSRSTYEIDAMPAAAYQQQPPPLQQHQLRAAQTGPASSAASGRGKAPLAVPVPAAAASSGPVERRAPASAAPSAASDVGSSASSGAAVRRSNSTGRAGAGGAGPKVRCRYCNEKMLASETSAHVCPPGTITNAVNNAATAAVATGSASKDDTPGPVEKLDGKKVKVVKRFAATMGDELALELGDVVLVEESFEDGWAVGRNRELISFMLCLSMILKKLNSVLG